LRWIEVLEFMGTVVKKSRLFGICMLAALLAFPIALQTSQVRAEGETSGLAQFLERLKKKKSRTQQGTVQSNANSGHTKVTGGGKPTTETEVVISKNVAPMLAADGEAKLQAAAERYRTIISQGGFPKVSRSNLKKGSEGKAVALLNQRLFLEGYVRVEATQGEYATLFTSATEEGVRRFQQNMGLAVTGKMDSVTADALNVPAQRRLATIEANIPRVAAYAENLGNRYLIVNIPAQQIETVSDGRVFSKHNAIVGRPERPSPVVMTALSDVNFNPYWNAPVSIVEKDIIPKLRGGTDVLRDMNIRVFDGVGGPEVDPDRINWRTAIPDNYHFRQEPGDGNAMATAKINFPSPFGVYMHDTPEKQLFNSNNRFYSSGCVRVQDMPLLVNWVLNGQEGIGEAEIATLAETLERRDVKLEAPPQVRFAYLTAWPTTGGTVAFRNDIYDLDGSGFVVGQPMPVGEMSPDGQRFVLKPLPRLVASVEDGNGSGGLFGFKRKPGSAAKRSSFFFNSGEPFERKNDQLRTGPNKLDPAADKKAKLAAAEKAKKAKLAKANGDAPGLFDWAAWRKEQAAAAKSGKAKKIVKKKTKDDEKKVAQKSKVKTDEKKVAAVEKKAADPKAKKAAVATAKADDKSKKIETAKKPDAKKLDCTAGKDGKLPDGCKAAAIEKKKASTAAN
jgi:L,D-transpeptidase YcbB